jgi:hypothetical protein
MSIYHVIVDGGKKVRLPTSGKYCDRDIVVETKLAGDYTGYEGEYEVTPQTEDQTLPTEKKFLNQDLRINKVPYSEVSNHTGGKTVTIG